MIAELEPFRQWLSRTLQRPVEMVVARTYRESGELVASGGAQLGLLPPLLFVQTTARQPRLRPLALRLNDGSRGSDAYLLARDDIPVAGANDLRGRTVCLVDRESTTGFLLPRIWMRDAGLDPDKDVRTLLSGDHMSVLRDMSSRRCDAGAVYSGAYLSARQEGIEVGSTRVLAITGRAPQDVMAASPDLPAAEASRIQQALIGFEPRRDIGAPRIGEILGISGFAPFSAAEFDRIREAAAKEGLLEHADAGPL
jgi:phosphonate transport system substrate-binding protein